MQIPYWAYITSYVSTQFHQPTSESGELKLHSKQSEPNHANSLFLTYMALSLQESCLLDRKAQMRQQPVCFERPEADQKKASFKASQTTSRDRSTQEHGFTTQETCSRAGPISVSARCNLSIIIGHLELRLSGAHPSLHPSSPTLRFPLWVHHHTRRGSQKGALSSLPQATCMQWQPGQAAGARKSIDATSPNPKVPSKPLSTNLYIRSI